MKIAIPCENGEVMQHFGHAKEFAIYAIEDIKPIEKETVTFDEVDHETVARGLKSRGVDLIICGEIGAGARSAVENAHMLLISGVTGEADEAVDSFLEGRLELMTGLRRTADAFAASGKVVEVNTGGISRGWMEDAYPSPAFRALLRARGVRFVLSSDAHAAEAIDCAFDRFGNAEAFARFPFARPA